MAATVANPISATPPIVAPIMIPRFELLPAEPKLPGSFKRVKSDTSFESLLAVPTIIPMDGAKAIDTQSVELSGKL
jgi:hypothetical protein